MELQEPWNIADVEKHYSGLSQKQKQKWVTVANSVRRQCLENGGSKKECDEKAIKVANSKVESMEEKHIIKENPVKLVESPGADGELPIKIISPGWGSSGYYSESLLKDAAPVYTEGLKMYWNHPTRSEESERPERDLNDLAGVLTSNAEFKEGPDGPGLYAKAKVFEKFKKPVEEMAPYIGLSHRASGKAYQGEVDGKTGAIISEINEAHSVDFVTMPGAGGQITELFESYRPKDDNMDKYQELKESYDSLKGEKDQLKESYDQIAQEKKDLEEKSKKLEEDNQRYRELFLTQEARKVVAEELKESKLPEVTKSRLVESLAGKYEVNDKGEIDKDKFKEAINKAVEQESEYLSKLGAGQVKDFGESKGSDETFQEAVDSWKLMGYDEEQAKQMAKR
jgi:hypothetical protein